jgi:hypothetical protein
MAALSRPLTAAAAVAVAIPAAVVLIWTTRRRPAAALHQAQRLGPSPALHGRCRRRRPFPAPHSARERRPPLHDPGRRRTAAAWAALVVLAAAVELVAFARQPAYDVASPGFPTLSVLLDPLTEAGPTRFLAWCCWLWAGWALARR